jgi:hypothetical protein
MHRAKSKLEVASIFAMMCLLAASSTVSVVNAASNDSKGNAASTSSFSPPADSCASAIAQAYDGMDQMTAIANAEASSLYSSGVASYYQPTFNSIFQIAKGTSSCQEDVESYNVVFVLHNSSGSIVDNLVITESQNLSVLGSSVQPDRVVNSPTTYDQPKYAGYSASPSSGGTIDTYATYIAYNQSSAGYPTGGCVSGRCYVSTWTGLANNGQSTGDIAQDGTTADCKGNGCTSQYFAWYETVGTGGAYVNCSSTHGGYITISTDDDIYAYVQNNFYNGGSDSTYTAYIEDLSNSDESCYVGDISFSAMTAPTWAEWITELPDYLGTQPLAKFGTVSFTDQAFENASTSDNISPYAAYQKTGYSYLFYFESGASCAYPCVCDDFVQNIATSSMTSSGDFKNHYLSSTNTPAPCT